MPKKKKCLLLICSQVLANNQEPTQLTAGRVGQYPWPHW
jgi:hypothetical protein